MEQLLGFAATVIIISTSGVMSPGPLFAANIFYGLKEGAKGGLKMSFGHTVVELPLIILLGIGIVSLESVPQFRIIIAILGALGLFGFAGLQLKSVFDNDANKQIKTKYGPFFSGV
ncbi:MAG TPA: LysE family transporter, partial [Nitrosopumilaceae archaeon]|nr:LysE family transporter [Nitrosopumilaceae archaeon]